MENKLVGVRPAAASARATKGRQGAPAAAAPPSLASQERAAEKGHRLDRVPVRAGESAVAAPTLLERLHGAVTRTGNEVLGDRWSPESCPDMQSWFAKHAETQPAHLEKIVRRYGRAQSGTSIEEAIEASTQRVRGTFERWEEGQAVSWRTGHTGLPIAIQEAPPVGSDDARKSARKEPDRHSVTVEELGPASPLESATASRMSRAFGVRLDDVPVHTNPAAEKRTRSLGADALAIGGHVAFAAGHYRPRTPGGDQLIAHELAHVLQHRRAQPSSRPGVTRAPVDRSAAHERDADRVADSAVDRLRAPSLTAASIPALQPSLSSAPAVRLGLQKNKYKDVDEDRKKAAAKSVKTGRQMKTEAHDLEKTRTQEALAASGNLAFNLGTVGADALLPGLGSGLGGAKSLYDINQTRLEGGDMGKETLKQGATTAVGFTPFVGPILSSAEDIHDLGKAALESNTSRSVRKMKSAHELGQTAQEHLEEIEKHMKELDPSDATDKAMLKKHKKAKGRIHRAMTTVDDYKEKKYKKGTAPLLSGHENEEDLSDVE